MTKDIDETNRYFYNNSGSVFDAIPFESILPELFLKYGKGQKILEIGSGPGALAIWLKEKGNEVTCLEPAEALAEIAAKRGLEVYPLTIQEFTTFDKYDCVMAISSLIHVPKKDLSAQIEKIADLLNPQGSFFVSFIEGNSEDFEDPTDAGNQRFFSKITEFELNEMLSPFFEEIEGYKIYNQVMDRTFFLKVLRKNQSLP